MPVYHIVYKNYKIGSCKWEKDINFPQIKIHNNFFSFLATYMTVLPKIYSYSSLTDYQDRNAFCKTLGFPRKLLVRKQGFLQRQMDIKEKKGNGFSRRLIET